MDPISAAGIGLSITSLVLQVFAGCIKGYQLFVEADGMPANYHHLRVRLRIEQSRLLHWGEETGLLEDLLDKPSRTLQLNRNLILDVLLDVQRLFRDCVKVTARYDSLVHEPSTQPVVEDPQSPRNTNTFLHKTLAILEKTPQAPRRMQWAMVKKEAFTKLIEKLIGYNDSIESILDRNALDQLQLMQQQTHMMMLQLTSKVDELKDFSLALRVQTQPLAQDAPTLLSRSSTLVANSPEQHTDFAALADFKARQLVIERDESSLTVAPLDKNDVRVDQNHRLRPRATYRNQQAWIEWKYYVEDASPHSNWNKTIEDRVQKLATLLGAGNKPKEFRAPQCLGYFDDRTDDHTRFGFVYEMPASSDIHEGPTSLADLFSSSAKPSLTKRITLAHAITQSLMYLHSVNWLHKGLRSDSIVFFASTAKGGSSQPNYSKPILAGFDYARPDLPEEITERPSTDIEHELYRHPDKIGNLSSRSKKSHDIYSLGIVLIEIAHWKGIDDVLEIDIKKKGARSAVRKIRDRLLSENEGCLEAVEAVAGETYAGVVRRCLTGGAAVGSAENADETDVAVGAKMQRILSEEIVGRVGNLRV